MQRQSEVTANLKSEQLLLFVFCIFYSILWCINFGCCSDLGKQIEFIINSTPLAIFFTEGQDLGSVIQENFLMPLEKSIRSLHFYMLGL